jgi:mono/diheme cytochrome c family protein
MPAYVEVLTDEQIMGILAYIRRWWTDDQRAYQAQVTAQLQAVWDSLGLDSVNLTPPAP